MSEALEIQERIQSLPANERKAVIMGSASSLAAMEKRELRAALDAPSPAVANTIWLRVVHGFCVLATGEKHGRLWLLTQQSAVEHHASEHAL